MRASIACLVALLLCALGALAQTSGRSGRVSPSTTTRSSQDETVTTTTTTTHHTTTTGPERSLEGCLMKEADDFFLIPRRGNPLKLQAGAGTDLAAQLGHHVRVQGIENAVTAVRAEAATTGGTTGATAHASSTASPNKAGVSGSVSAPAATAPAPAGSAAPGNAGDLHTLADHQISVDKITSVANTCRVNWTPATSAANRARRTR